MIETDHGGAWTTASKGWMVPMVWTTPEVTKHMVLVRCTPLVCSNNTVDLPSSMRPPVIRSVGYRLYQVISPFRGSFPGRRPLNPESTMPPTPLTQKAGHTPGRRNPIARKTTRRSGPTPTRTSLSCAAFCTWWRSWTGPPAGCSPGGSPTPSNATAAPRSSTPTRAASSPAWSSPPCSRTQVLPSPSTAGAGALTTSSSSACGAPSSTRPSTCTKSLTASTPAPDLSLVRLL